MTGSLIGAVVRDGRALFPHGDDVLEPGDRAIIFTPSGRVQEVERTL
jgi:trk system potassium uptake protein TrkA